MNLVDLISSHMTGDVVGTLGGLVGASPADTRAATTAAIPALLSALSGVASTPKGAEGLASAMGGLDLSMLGNLAGGLGGDQAQALGGIGDTLLGSLLGGSGTAKIVDALAAFAGLKPGVLRSLLTYLVPIVLGMIAKQLGGKPSAASLVRLFAEQQSNIKAAIPRGLSLATVGGQPAAKAGMPGWLPLAAMVAVAAGGWWWLNRDRMNPPAGRDVVEEVVETISIDPRFLEAGTVAAKLFTGLTKTLGGVTDEASARAALPELEKLAPMLTTLEDEAGRLPADEKPAFAAMIAANLGTVQKLIDTVMAIPGVKDLLGPTVTPIVETLTKLGT